MAEFQTSQYFVVTMLMRMESQISKLELVESETDDEEPVEGRIKSQGQVSRQAFTIDSVLISNLLYSSSRRGFCVFADI